MAHVQALRTMLASVPLSEDLFPRVEDLIKACSQAELLALGLGPPPRPVVPAAKTLQKLLPAARLQAVQRVISSLQYNHMPGYLYNVAKDRPFSSIMNTAKQVLLDALPIKCVEAVFLGLFLTNSWTDLDRLPVGFKSKCQGNTYRHIVLAVHHTPSGTWGALGISRRPELQFKDLTATSLAQLMADYKASYEQWGHTLYKIRVGLPVAHDADSPGPVCWRYCNVSCQRHPWARCVQVLDAFSDNARLLAQRFKLLGVKPPSSQRNALSGTTPEPGAARPPPAAIPVATSRYMSVSPSKRNSLAKPHGAADSSMKPGSTLPLTPTRKGSISAPPRPRPIPSPPAGLPPCSPTTRKDASKALAAGSAKSPPAAQRRISKAASVGSAAGRENAGAALGLGSPAVAGRGTSIIDQYEHMHGLQLGVPPTASHDAALAAGVQGTAAHAAENITCGFTAAATIAAQAGDLLLVRQGTASAGDDGDAVAVNAAAVVAAGLTGSDSETDSGADEDDA